VTPPPATRSYYFSALTGDDSRTPVQAQDPATPWKTLAKLNSYSGSLVPGDQVLFKRGETYTGSILLTASGTATKPIVLGAWGTGTARPILNGMVAASSWTQVTGSPGVWESNTLATAGTTINMVTLNGTPVAMGRYPNAGSAGGGYLRFESHTSNTITDQQGALTPGDWVGGEVVIRSRRYALDRGAITAVTTGGTSSLVTYDNSGFAYAPNTDGYGYFLQGTLRSLDVLGEWYYLPSTHKIRMYFGSNDPTFYTVLVAATDVLLEPRVSNLTVRDLIFQGANTYGVWNDWGGYANLRFLHCDFINIGMDGILFGGKRGVTIDSCLFDYNNNTGVSLGYHDTTCIITNTTLQHIALFGGMLRNDEVQRQGYAIYHSGPVGSPGLTAYNNVIRLTGYSGIFFDGDNNLLQGNVIDSTCMVLDDGGGIYTGSFSGATNTNNVIVDNLVFHSLGASDGAVPLSGTRDTLAHGIYLDDNANHLTVQGNTSAFNGFSGIFLHNANNFTVTDNVLYGNGVAQLYMQDDALGGALTGGVIRRNDLFSTTGYQLPLYLQSSANNFTSFATLDSNHYATPFGVGTVAYTNCFSCTPSEHVYTLSGWRALGSQDLHTTAMPKTIASLAEVRFEYNTTLTSRELRFCGLGYMKLSSQLLRNRYTLRAKGSVVLLTN
jgi:parallel beta-helix repeat protein